MWARRDLHVVFICFLIEALRCSPVKEQGQTIHSLFSSLPNEPCSLDVSNIDNKQFERLCGDKKVEDVNNVTEDTFSFDFLSLSCYTVYHNTKVLCSEGAQKDQTALSTYHKESDATKFCSSIPKIAIDKKCTAWLEDPEHRSEEDCQLVSKVVGNIVANESLCQQNCISGDKVNPVCHSLVLTSVALAERSKANTAAADVGAAAALTVAKPGENEAEAGKTQVKEAVTSDQATTNQEALKEKEATSVQNTESPKAENNKVVADVDQAKSLTQAPAAKKSEEESKDDIQTNADTNPQANEAQAEEKEVTNDNVEDYEVTADNTVAQEEKTEDDTINLVSTAGIEEDEGEKQESSVITESKKEEETVKDQFIGSIGSGPDIEAESSFFSYFVLLSVVCIIAYLVFHNKQKVKTLHSLNLSFY